MSKRLPKGPWATIVADPPWPEPIGTVRERQRAGTWYPLMTYEAIAALPVMRIAAEAAHLYLWATQRSLREAFRIVAAWGFDYKQVLTWCKLVIRGPRRYWQTSSEFCLFGTRTNLKTATHLSAWFLAPRREHSRKPEEFFEMVEASSPEPRLEMFARRRRRGWRTWGDEVCRTI